MAVDVLGILDMFSKYRQQNFLLDWMWDVRKWESRWHQMALASENRGIAIKVGSGVARVQFSTCSIQATYKTWKWRCQVNH